MKTENEAVKTENEAVKTENYMSTLSVYFLFESSLVVGGEVCEYPFERSVLFTSSTNLVNLPALNE